MKPPPGSALPSEQAVVATYDDMAQVRRAIDALQYSGVEANRIKLGGEGAAAAARATDAARDTSAADRPMLWRILWRGFWWGVWGGIAGALLGLLFSYFGFGFLPGVDRPLIQIVSWAMFGHVAGALWGCYAALTTGDAWGLTFQPTEGGTIRIAVRSTDPRDIERAERVFREKQAISVTRETE